MPLYLKIYLHFLELDDILYTHFPVGIADGIKKEMRRMYDSTNTTYGL